MDATPASPSDLTPQTFNALIDLEIPGATGPLPDGSLGINIAAAQTNFPLQGLQLYIQPWSAMATGDSYQIMLDNRQVASGVVGEGETNARVVAFVPSSNLINASGQHDLAYVIRRLGQNSEQSGDLRITVKQNAPGGVDEDGSTPGHSELSFSLPSAIEQGGVDAADAKAGVTATIHPYPNMAEGDDIKLSWGGQFVHHHPVSQGEINKDIKITIDEQTILAAGDVDEPGLSVTFEVYDLVLNRSSDWSAEKRITVDTGNSRLEAPFVEEAVNGTLDLDVLGAAVATLQIWAASANFALGDQLIGRVSGTADDGALVSYESPAVTVNALNRVYVIQIPNAIVRRLAKTQAVFSYTRTRAGNITRSRGQFVNVIGSAVGMAAPIAKDAVQGALAPELTRTYIEIPWDDSMASGDQVTLRWIGIRADLTVYDPVLAPRSITGRDEANKLPLSIIVDGVHLKAIDGGTLQLFFELAKDTPDGPVVRESARATLLAVGAPRAELPLPIVEGVEDGVINPDLPGTTLTVPRYSTMQIGDVVHYLWDGTHTEELEDSLRITSFSKDKDVVFNIEAQFIKDNEEGSIAASYWVDRIEGRRSNSEILEFQVGTQRQVLPPPSVPGSEDGTLDLAEVPDGASVVIAAWPNMAAGDQVYMTWADDQGTPAFTLDRSIRGNDIGRDVTFTVPLVEVTKNVNGHVSVSYRVEPLEGGDLASQIHSFDVRKELPIQLPLPIIVEAVGGLLDPENALSGAKVRIAVEAQLKTGDSVTLTWAGQPGSGSVTPTQPVVSNGELLIPIAYATVKANDGFQVTLSYTVRRADGTVEGPSPINKYDVKSAIAPGLLNVMGARFCRGTYRASAGPSRISAFNDTTGNPLVAEWQYQGDATWIQGNTWEDTRPEVELHVRTSDDHVVLKPVNFIGNGNDITTVGDAAQVAHRDIGDVVGWGHAAYGGAIPATIITMDDIVEVCCTRSAYAARRENSHVVAWGNAVEGGSLGAVASDNFVSLSSNSIAFAGIKADGKVYGWGNAAAGGQVPDAIQALSDITQVIGAGTAFSAIRKTGQVVAWGTAAAGGVVPPDIGTFTDIIKVSGNFTAFAALRRNGRVVAWGTAANGGTVSQEAAAATVAQLGASTARAFSLITTSGQVVAWGDLTYGGNVPADIRTFTDIREVSATWQAFAALRGNGRVVAWGVGTTGGIVPADIATLNDIVQVVGNSKAFAALRRNGTVVAWGDATVGGNTAAVVTQLIKVKAVYANSQSFVALRSDGEIVTWGNAAGGGDSSAVQSLLRNRVSYERSLAVSSQALRSQGVLNQTRRSISSPAGSKSTRSMSSLSAFSLSLSQWAKPRISEAPGDLLDPGNSPDRPIVVAVPPGALQYRDRVNLYIEDNLFDYAIVGRNGPGNGIEYDVPASEFIAYTGGQMRVWYGVVPSGDTEEQPSDILLLTISGGFEDDATLDLSAHNYVVAEAKAPAKIPDFAQVTRTGDWGTGPYTYTSSDESIATVNSRGTVTALANGKTTITGEDSLGTTASYTLTVQGIVVVHFVTANATWAVMQSTCAQLGLEPVSLTNIKALWSRYADSLPVTTYLGWLNYPFWTNDSAGAGTYWTYDLSGSDVNQNASAADAELPMQALGISRTGAGVSAAPASDQQ